LHQGQLRALKSQDGPSEVINMDSPFDFPPDHSAAGCCSDAQILLWLRALLTVAWVDGNFDPMEQELITTLTQHTLTVAVGQGNFSAVTGPELATAFGTQTDLGENFLRTAVMVALADGVYSTLEDALLLEFCQGLGLSTQILETLRLTLDDAGTAVQKATGAARLGYGNKQPIAADAYEQSQTFGPAFGLGDPLAPVRTWLDNLTIHDPRVASFLCQLIPAQWPLERDVILFGKKLGHIPPMSQLHPLYEQLVSLRLRALAYLAESQ
jgi:tellurite resistance protein